MTPGRRILTAAWAGTVAFAASAVLAVFIETARAAAFGVDVVLFAVGTVVFGWALVVAANRSRTDELGIGGLFFLAGTAPPPVRRQLLGSWVLQVVVAFATAAARPYTSLAFGILVPVFGLALCGLWSAKHGTFGPRQLPDPRQKRADIGNDAGPG